MREELGLVGKTASQVHKPVRIEQELLVEEAVTAYGMLPLLSMLKMLSPPAHGVVGGGPGAVPSGLVMKVIAAGDTVSCCWLNPRLTAASKRNSEQRSFQSTFISLL
jgi:hypothetical protein